MRPSFLGAVGWLALLALGFALGLQWVTPRKVRQALRSADTLHGPLDETLACDLISESAPRSKINCQLAHLTVGDDVARFVDVWSAGEKTTWCFARPPAGWRVLRQAEGVPCFATAPPVDDADAFERERVARWAQDEFAARLRGLRAALADPAPRRARCVHDVWTQVPVIELDDVVLGSRLHPGWDFLATPWLREAVEAPEDPQRVLAAFARWPGTRGWVAVVTGKKRQLAHLASGGALYEFEHGHFEGTVTLVDPLKVVVECEAPFSFASSATLPMSLAPVGGVRFPVLETVTEARVAGDFAANYRDALQVALNGMTGYRVYPVLH